MLLARYQHELLEAGCDEAGRGCLAGPVFAAAVILAADFDHHLLNDSKQLAEDDRYQLREEIEKTAVAYAIASVDNEEIDKINEEIERQQLKMALKKKVKAYEKKKS